LYGFMGMMKSGRTTIDVLAFNSIVWIRLGKTLWVVAVSGFLSIPLYGFYSDVLSRRGETVPSAFNSIVWILLCQACNCPLLLGLLSIPLYGFPAVTEENWGTVADVILFQFHCMDSLQRSHLSVLVDVSSFNSIVWILLLLARLV
jgi:hypothetical protein